MSDINIQEAWDKIKKEEELYSKSSEFIYIFKNIIKDKNEIMKIINDFIDANKDSKHQFAKATIEGFIVTLISQSSPRELNVILNDLLTLIEVDFKSYALSFIKESVN